MNTLTFTLLVTMQASSEKCCCSQVLEVRNYKKNFILVVNFPCYGVASLMLHVDQTFEEPFMMWMWSGIQFQYFQSMYSSYFPEKETSVVAFGNISTTNVDVAPHPNDSWELEIYNCKI